MTTTDREDLTVPHAARKAFAEQHRLPLPNSSAVDWDEVDRDLRALARPMVAAELRRLADLHEAPTIDWEPSDLEAADLGARDEIAGALRLRADALDPS